MQGRPHETILDYAASRDIDLIVMPTRGQRGLERFLLGSTTERAVRLADAPVLTLRPGDDGAVTYPYRTVLVPTDGSGCAAAAVDLGIDVAAAEGAALHVLSVVDVATLGVDVRADIQASDLEASAERIVDEASAAAADAGVGSVATAVEFGASVAGEIRRYAEDHDVGLVVVGTHGRTGFDRSLLGSVAERLVRTSPVPVMTVRAPVS